MSLYQVISDGKTWKVERNGNTLKEGFRKKDRAKKYARKKASPGDTLQCQKRNGHFQKRKKVK